MPSGTSHKGREPSGEPTAEEQAEMETIEAKY